MKVIIARHGQTAENAKQIDIGHDSQSLLNEEGVEQAKKLAEYLKNENIHAAYASPQARAVHTAQEVLRFHPKAILVKEDHLREQRLGIYESVPKHVFKQARMNSKDPFHLFKPDGGESYAELQTRVKVFFSQLIDKHENDTVLLVSHGGTLGMLYLDFLGKPITQEHYQAHKPNNAEFTIVEISKNEKPNIRLLNSREHLIS